MDRTREVIELIAKETGMSEKQVKPQSKLEDDLSMNELERIELVFMLEENFVIEIDDDEIEKWETVADIIACVNNKTEQNNG